MAKKIAVAIRKGGVGKTTTVKNLGAALHGLGQRVLIVDLDEQANATTGLGVDYQAVPATLNHLFADPSLDPRADVVETDWGVHLLAGSPELKRTEAGMALQRTDPLAPDPMLALRGLLAPLDAAYDVMLFDTPPSIDFMTLNALTAADELLVPVAASADSEGGLKMILDAYERTRSTHNPGLSLRGILLTRVKRTNASAAVLDSVTREHEKAVFPQAIVEATAVDEATQLRQSIVAYDPDSAAGKAYRRLAELILAPEAAS